MGKGYCFTCQREVKSGFCKGTPDKPHALEPCPPCAGCKGVCDWRDYIGCKRFTLKGKNQEQQMVRSMEQKRVILKERRIDEILRHPNGDEVRYEPPMLEEVDAKQRQVRQEEDGLQEGG